MVRWFSKIVRRRFYDRIMEPRWRAQNMFLGTDAEWGANFREDGPRVGILYDVAHEHSHYIAACHELGVGYKVFDVRRADWAADLLHSDCKVFLVWPTIYKPIQKTFWDERLHTINSLMQRRIFPSFDLMWLYESKRRTAEWLEINGLPAPRTYTFFSAAEATEHLSAARFPLVCKTDQGAASSGVYIVRSVRQARKLIDLAFSSGISLKNRGRFDRHQGYIIFQEFLPNCKEWRVIRVGESYFCRLKLKKGDFHSGSGDIVWAEPPLELLELTRSISSKFQVPNINVDFFETTDGRFLVNELHALWGGRVLEDKRLEGRYKFNEATQRWCFEQGDFFRNRCANLRLEWLIEENWV